MATKKFKLIAAVCVVAFSVAAVFGGCSSESTGSAPKVDGAHDIDCVANTTVDLLDGVAALDEEDGDITPSMTIKVAPEVEVSDGYAVFPSEGSYRVTYTVADSDGNTSYDTAIVTAVERETYLDFVSVNGFRGVASGGASLTKNGMYDGVYTIEGSGCEIAEDLQLTRTYTLINGYTYTFTYAYYSSAGGRAYIYADGTPAGEVIVYEGDNTLTFTYHASQSTDVEIALLLGGIGGSITFNLHSASYSYPKDGTESLLDGFTFDSSNTISRFEESGSDITEGSVSADGSSATLTVTKLSESPSDWKGGMFINTGITTQWGTDYVVSFTIESTQANDYVVSFQPIQWNDGKVYVSDLTLTGGTTHNITETITPTTETAEKGYELWLYIQSGTALNTITISDLKVEVTYSGVQTSTISLKDFTASNSEGYEGTLTTSGGSFTYTVPEFSSTDWHQQVISPEFYVSGSGSNYIITFKAKATKPVVTVFAAPVYGGWDPTLAWERITITEEEQEFAIWCSDNGGNTNYLVWQFGASANVKYKNVTIEITDIKICYKNTSLD